MSADLLGGMDAPLNGAVLLDDVCAWLRWFVKFPSPEAADAATLYAAATHAATDLQFGPRLRVKSPQKRCGKSRLLEVLSELVRNPLKTVSISAAALVRSIDPADPPTIVFDESDAVFGKGLKGDEKAENLRGILNAGFDRNQPYVRWDVTTRALENCPTFALAIIAGIGDLPDTIEDRAVPLVMARKMKEETCLRTGPHGACPFVHKYRPRRDAPLLRALRDRLSSWVVPLAGEIGTAEPVMPDGLSDRAEDVWEALIAVADLAGGNWPKRARDAAVKLMAEAETGGADRSLSIRLLADLRQVFTADKMFTYDLIGALCRVEESPWRTVSYGKPLDANRLSELLRPYDIRPQQIWHSGANTRGYHRAQFEDSWKRYLPPGDSYQAGGAARPAMDVSSQANPLAANPGLAGGGARPIGPQGSHQGPSNLAGLAGTPTQAGPQDSIAGQPGIPGDYAEPDFARMYDEAWHDPNAEIE